MLVGPSFLDSFFFLFFCFFSFSDCSKKNNVYDYDYIFSRGVKCGRCGEMTIQPYRLSGKVTVRQPSYFLCNSRQFQEDDVAPDAATLRWSICSHRRSSTHCPTSNVPFFIQWVNTVLWGWGLQVCGSKSMSKKRCTFFYSKSVRILASNEWKKISEIY